MTTNPPIYVREDRLVHSRKPLALDLASWSVTGGPTTWGRAPGPIQHGEHWLARINVIAVRGSVAKPKVTLGYISDSYVVVDWRTDVVPQTVAEFMAGFDSVYGVSATATWDGESLWTESGAPAEIARAHELLAPILENLPAVPEGYDGWWLRSRGSK